MSRKNFTTEPTPPQSWRTVISAAELDTTRAALQAAMIAAGADPAGLDWLSRRLPPEPGLVVGDLTAICGGSGCMHTKGVE